MRNPKSWNESEALCNRYGGHLATLTSFQELNFVLKLCGEVINGCWVGGRGINSTVGFGWKWSDNASYWNESMFLGASVPSSCPNSSCHTNNSFDLCTLVTNVSKSLISERCNMSHAFVCMFDMGMHFLSLSSYMYVSILILLVLICYFLSIHANHVDPMFHFLQGAYATTCTATRNILSYLQL